MAYGKIYVDHLEDSNGDILDVVEVTTTEASTSAKGYMSAADKTKLDGIEATDYATAAQGALADSALQSHQDISSKADLVGGVIPTSQIPAIAITEFLGDVANQAAMLALSGQKGDWCNRTDVGLSFVITGADPTQLSSWTDLVYPAAPVTSVNSQTGSVVLAAGDVGAVSDAGDNMTGNLTLGTDKIELNAANGNINAAGITSAKALFSIIPQAVANPSNYSALLVDYLGAPTAAITADGTTTIAGQLTVDTNGDYAGVFKNNKNGSPWQSAAVGRNLASGGPVWAGLAHDFAGTAVGVTSQILENGNATFRTLEVQGQNAYASSASSLATSTSAAALRVQGSSNSSDSLWMGVETSDAKPYIQGANGVGNNPKDILLNPFGGSVGIGGTVAPLAHLHLLDKTFSNWDSSLNKNRAVLRLETHYNALGTRVADDYGSGIVFNHLGGHSTTHSDNSHAFIGLRVHDIPGHERSKLIFATNDSVTTADHDGGLVEAMHIKPSGSIHMAKEKNDVGALPANVVNQKLTIMPSTSAYPGSHVLFVGQYNGNWEEGTGGYDSCFGLGWSFQASSGSSQALRAGIAYDHKASEEFKYWSTYGPHAFYVDSSGNETAETCSNKAMQINTNTRVDIGDELGVPHAGQFQVIHTGGGQQHNDCLAYLETNANDWCMKTNYNSAGNHYHMYFMQQGGIKGHIYGNSGANVLYTAGSDYRWKENIVEMTGAQGIDICKKLKPSHFNWIENRIQTGEINTVDGFLAHEVQEAGVLGAVNGEKDAVNDDGSIDGQTMDYGQMTPVLTAAIKGLIAKVETLEARVADLEGL